MRWFSVAAAALWLAGCAGASLDDPDETRAALVHGTPDTGDPFVGIANGYCTGTLIGRRTVLTAAHCGSNAHTAPFCVYPCNNWWCTGQCASGPFVGSPSYNGEFDDDVGIILLDHDFTAQTGIVPRRIGSVPIEGTSIYLVGYGRSDPNDANTFGYERSGYNTIDSVHAKTIDYDDNSLAYGASGDSGGPAFVRYTDCEVGVQVGQSGGIDNDYELTRLDAQVAWIKTASHDPTVYACGQASCGDGFCQDPEWCGSCPQDCGACQPPPPDVCGDGVCGQTEDCSQCAIDCVCPPVCPRGTHDCCGIGECMTPSACRRFDCQ